MNTLRVETRDAWRAWLTQHFDSECEVWLIFHKAHTGKCNLSYDASVEEALCFGWIDSLIKRLDEDRYARKFTPRRSGSVWSELNKARAEKMIAANRMTEAGMTFVREAKETGEWDHVRVPPTAASIDIPDELRHALQSHPTAAEAFDALAPTYQKQYIVWIATAVRPETRQRRTKEAIKRLNRGERLGLK